MATRPTMTAGDLVRLIRARHEARAGWCVVEQAPNGTGYHASRFCDVLVLQTWPSRGLSAYGFEVKVDRRDLVRELREPRKADAFQKWCDRWWIAIPDAALIEGLALPETWGVMVVKKGKLAVHREAPALTPEVWSKAFVAAIARSLTEGVVPKRELEEARQQNHVEVDEKIRAAVERDRLARGGAAAQLEQLQQTLAAFHEASGVDLTAPRSNGRQIGAAVAMVQRLLDDHARLDAFKHLLGAVDDAVKRLRAVHDDVRDLVTPAPAKDVAP